MKQGSHQTEPRQGIHRAMEREERCSHVTEDIAAVIQGAYYRFYTESQTRNIELVQ